MRTVHIDVLSKAKTVCFQHGKQAPWILWSSLQKLFIQGTR